MQKYNFSTYYPNNPFFFYIFAIEMNSLQTTSNDSFCQIWLPQILYTAYAYSFGEVVEKNHLLMASIVRII